MTDRPSAAAKLLAPLRRPPLAPLGRYRRGRCSALAGAPLGALPERLMRSTVDGVLRPTRRLRLGSIVDCVLNLHWRYVPVNSQNYQRLIDLDLCVPDLPLASRPVGQGAASDANRDDLAAGGWRLVSPRPPRSGARNRQRCVIDFRARPERLGRVSSPCAPVWRGSRPATRCASRAPRRAGARYRDGTAARRSSASALGRPSRRVA